MGFVSFFYSNENDEPAHVHVEKGNCDGKIWLNPISVAYMHGFTIAESRQIIRIIENNIVTLIKRWDEYFS